VSRFNSFLAWRFSPASITLEFSVSKWDLTIEQAPRGIIEPQRLESDPLGGIQQVRLSLYQRVELRLSAGFTLQLAIQLKLRVSPSDVFCRGLSGQSENTEWVRRERLL
jgi:hypothetical protein